METPLPYCLGNLTVLSLELQWHETGDMYNGFPDYHSAAQREMVMANAATLQELTVTGFADWDFDLPALRKLTIANLLEAEPDTMQRVLQGSPLLTSLTITEDELMDTGESNLSVVLDALGSMPNALPLLTSFKLLASYADTYITANQQRAILNFLANKTRLRRLHVRLSRAGDVWPIMDILPRFPHLKVLGVELGSAVLTRELLEYCHRHLPLGLTDLLLITDFQEVRVQPADVFALVSAASVIVMRRARVLTSTSTYSSHLVPTSGA